MKIPSLRTSALLSSLICLLPSAVLAEGERWEVNGNAGTNGLGLELSYRMSEQLRIRSGYHSYDFSLEVDADDNNGTAGDELKNKGDLELSNLGLLVDWYPWAGKFRLSTGVIINRNEFSVETVCENPSGCEVGSNSFTRSEIGTITTRIDVDDYNPYIGFGWDKALDVTRRWNLSFEVGAYYQGTPSVEMTSSGSCTTFLIIQQCQTSFEEEEQELEDELEEFVWYPAISIGIGYRF